MLKINAPTQFLCFSQKLTYLNTAFFFNILLKNGLAVAQKKIRKKKRNTFRERKEKQLGILKLVKEILRTSRTRSRNEKEKT